MNNIELAKVKAFYYAKVVELGGNHEAAKTFIHGRCRGDEWSGICFSGKEPDWDFDEYRIKPETVIHPGGEYPKPLSDEAELSGIRCWMPKAGAEDNVGQIVFQRSTGEYLCHRLLKLGLLHKTEEAAIAHAKVIYQIED